jgi:hypothetical protein
VAPQLGQLLGQDKYERRARTILGICFFTIIFGALYFYAKETEPELPQKILREADGWVVSGLLNHHLLKVKLLHHSFRK